MTCVLWTFVRISDKMNYIKCIWRVGYVLKRFYGFG